LKESAQIVQALDYCLAVSENFAYGEAV